MCAGVAQPRLHLGPREVTIYHEYEAKYKRGFFTVIGQYDKILYCVCYWDEPPHWKLAGSDKYTKEYAQEEVAAWIYDQGMRVR